MVRRQTGPGPERLVTVSGQMWTDIVGSSNLGISSACGPSESKRLHYIIESLYILRFMCRGRKRVHMFIALTP